MRLPRSWSWAGEPDELQQDMNFGWLKRYITQEWCRVTYRLAFGTKNAFPPGVKISVAPMKPLPPWLEAKSAAARAARLDQPAMNSEEARRQTQRILQGEQSQFSNRAVVFAHFRGLLGLSTELVNAV